MKTLYRLEDVSISEEGTTPDLGALPSASIVLISVLGGVWIVISAYFVFIFIKSNLKNR